MGVFDFLDQGARAVGGTFAGRDWGAPDQPQMCTPQDNGPLGALPGGQSIGDFGRGVASEGLMGLLDPAGMMDRAAASRELSTMFNVRRPEDMVSRPGDAPTEVAGNTVTPEEYDRIVRTYSDIRLGRSDIDLNTAGMSDADAARFRGETMGDIGNILQTESGRALINDVAYQRDDHRTTINLRTDASGARDNSNAEGGSVPGRSGASFSDGVGGDAEVHYVPGDNGGIVQPTMSNAWLPMRSDVTLFHELAHARHSAYGTLDQNMIGTADAANPRDVGQWGGEYQAVGLGNFAGDQLTENTYRSERAAIGRSGIGARNTGGVRDADIVQRDSYTWF